MKVFKSESVSGKSQKMGARFYLEIIGGVVLILFGILFLRYLPFNFSELVTVVVFVGGGVLIIRKAVQKRMEAEKVPLDRANRKKEKNMATKSGAKGSR